MKMELGRVSIESKNFPDAYDSDGNPSAQPKAICRLGSFPTAICKVVLTVGNTQVSNYDPSRNTCPSNQLQIAALPLCH